MSDTPRTDKLWSELNVDRVYDRVDMNEWRMFAAELERELNRCRKGWETAADQPDVQEAVIAKLNLVHADAVSGLERKIK